MRSLKASSTTGFLHIGPAVPRRPGRLRRSLIGSEMVINKTVRRQIYGALPQQQEKPRQEKDDDGHGNPMPAGVPGAGPFFFAEFLADEALIIKGIVGQSEMVVGSLLRPAGLFVGTAVGAGPGIAWHLRAAMGADIRRCFHSMPAYSSSVSRPKPIST